MGGVGTSVFYLASLIGTTVAPRGERKKKSGDMTPALERATLGVSNTGSRNKAERESLEGPAQARCPEEAELKPGCGLCAWRTEAEW